MLISVGEPSPLFIAASTINPNFQFHSVAGRYVLVSLSPGSCSNSGNESTIYLLKQGRRKQ